MANELQRLLELACLEPGYGPAFYRCLLASEVYGIVPAPGHGKDDGIVRFVMWTGADGSQIIPYFSERAKVRRALTGETVSLRINGRTLMEATRGATLVLNPNEPNTCRLAPWEITALLETGAISDPEWVQLIEQRMFAFDAVPDPPVAMLSSLIVLYATHPIVERACLVSYYPEGRPEQLSLLIGVRVDAGSSTERLVRECSAVIHDVPPGRPVDFMIFTDDQDPTLQAIETLAKPFFDRAMGAGLVAPVSGALS